MSESEDIDDLVEGLRDRVYARPRRSSTSEDLEEVEAALAKHPESVELWVVRGDFIQLCDDEPCRWELEDALRSYQRAAELGPDCWEPPLEIGHYLDVIDDDPAAAIPFFERAVELGGGKPARDALAEARRQVEQR